MEFLKKLTKAVSVVLASVSVLSVGLSASALGDKCAIFKTADGVQYNIEEGTSGPRKGMFSFFNSLTDKADYGIFKHPETGRYCLLDVSARRPLFSINNPAARDDARSYEIGYSDDITSSAASPVKLPRKWKINGNRYVKFSALKMPKPTSPDHVGHILDGNDRELATIYTKGFSQHIIRVITFLATMALVK